MTTLKDLVTGTVKKREAAQRALWEQKEEVKKREKANFSDVLSALWPLRSKPEFSEGTRARTTIRWVSTWSHVDLDPPLKNGQCVRIESRGWGTPLTLSIRELPPPDSDLEKLVEADPRFVILLAYPPGRSRGSTLWQTEIRMVDEVARWIRQDPFKAARASYSCRPELTELQEEVQEVLTQVHKTKRERLISDLGDAIDEVKSDIKELKRKKKALGVK